MPEWKIGGRDVDGFITSYMCPECGYRIKPTYILKSCPNCHLEMVSDVKPHYRIKGIGDDGWYHYELINPERLMKVVIDDKEAFTVLGFISKEADQAVGKQNSD